MCFFLRYALLIRPALKDLPWSPGYHGLRPHGLSRRWSYDEGQDQWLYVVQQFAACVFLPNLRSEELEGVCTSVAHSGTPGHVSGSVCWWLLVAAFFRLWYFVISKILVAIHMWMVSHIQGCQEGCDRKEMLYGMQVAELVLVLTDAELSTTLGDFGDDRFPARHKEGTVFSTTSPPLPVLLLKTYLGFLGTVDYGPTVLAPLEQKVQPTSLLSMSGGLPSSPTCESLLV